MARRRGARSAPRAGGDLRQEDEGGSPRGRARLRIHSRVDETRMKTFHCTHCQNLIFFENVRCLSCGHALAFLPDLGIMGALTESSDGLWRADMQARTQQVDSRGYRLCANYDQVSVCNWVIPA